MSGGGWRDRREGCASRCVFGEVSVNLVTMAVSLIKTLINLPRSRLTLHTARDHTATTVVIRASLTANSSCLPLCSSVRAVSAAVLTAPLTASVFLFVLL